MRSFFLLVPALIMTASLLRAQTNAAPAAPSPIGFLTQDQQIEYAQAHARALADNPAIKAEGDALKQEAVSVLSSGSAEDKQALRLKMAAHRQKLRAAMLKEDPNLGPIFTLIDNQLSKAKATGAAPGQ